MSEAGGDAYWAHILWQRHNLRIEDFYEMSRRMKLLYIASELLEDKKPFRHDTVPLTK